MKKTLLVTLDFSPRIGGVARYLEEMTKRLPPDRIVVLTVPEDSNTREFDSQQPYRVIRKNLFFSSRWLWPKWIPALWRILRVIRKENIEIVLVGQILPIGTIAWILQQFFHLPYIIMTNGMEVTFLFTSPRKKWLAKRILRDANGVTTISRFTRQKLLDLEVESSKITFLPPATNIESWKTTISEETFRVKHHLNNKKILLTIGRIVERKGHLDVLKALPDLLKEIPNLLYCIGSRGPFQPVLEKTSVRLGLENSVRFLGKIPDEELSSWYRICDVFVMPAYQLEDGDVEGFGIVYLEANAFGKPVVGYRSGGVEDAVIDGKTGLLVNQGNVEELTKTILKILRNPNDAQQLGEQGRERVLREFRWDDRAQKLQQLLSFSPNND